VSDVLELGFRAFDPHELLPHALAARAGLFEDAGIEVRLRDLTFAPDDVPQVSCGAALIARLQGVPVRVVLVAARRPLFWLVRPAGATGSTRRIASYPGGSPPALFARLALPPAEHVPARDDDARLGLLLAGEVDGAIVSSIVDPALLEAIGLRRTLALSDAVTVPTTGLAVPDPLDDSRSVDALAGALRRALHVLHDDPDEVARALVDRFRFSPASAVTSARDLAGSFTRHGTVTHDEAKRAIATIAGAIGVSPPVVEHVYAPESLA
jgi:ABC-type nitrate/sulfonate/bicarbonate transport system substrate-binding protein